MDRLLRSPSPPLSSKKLAHHRHALSPPPYAATYDGDDDRPYPDERPSARRSDKHNEPDNSDKTAAKKPRHRHSPVQLAALNELFDRDEHPSLDERTELAKKLGMEAKTVHAWFQNKRASTRKRNKTTPADALDPASEKSPKRPLPSSNLPSIANLLNSTPPVTAPQHSSRPRSHASSARRSRQKDLHLNDHILADPIATVPRSQNLDQEATLESSFFAGPSEIFGQDRFILSHHRGHQSETGAVPQLHNHEPNHMVPDADSRFVSENDAVPSRRGRLEAARMRTSPEQAEELRRAYALNDHPTREQRQELADKIGLRLQSVTNWFQNQRSQAKKHREESASTSDVAAHRAQRQPSGSRDGSLTSHISHPPRSHHPSLTSPEHESRSALLKRPSAGVDDHRQIFTPRSRMSLPPSLNSQTSSPRIRRNIIPYARGPRDLHIGEGKHYDNSSEGTRVEDTLTRPRRSRPEPRQLDALKKLLHRTLTPSIEERSALALEIGMDVGKVTNWFRNIRQNARKRGRRPMASAAASANPRDIDVSSGSSVYDDDDNMDLIYEDIMDQEMDDRSEEEYQEAVTPFTDVSSSPPPNKRPRSHLPNHDETERMDTGLVKPSSLQEFRKVVATAPVGPSDCDIEMNAVTYPGVKIEDALLLLSFHQHVVQ